MGNNLILALCGTAAVANMYRTNWGFNAELTDGIELVALLAAIWII